MKILFLDIDGVCNNHKTSQADGWGIDPYMAFMVGKIQMDTGCHVVLSSSWRFSPEGIDKVENRVVKILDITTTEYDKDKRTRGDEIQKWLNKQPQVERYAILDDENDFLPHQLTHLFKTSFLVGLTPEIAQEVTNYLNK